MSTSVGRSQPPPRARRDDGASTKAQLLEAAGEVFAEKGFERATGKEISERAGSSSAAVNYYYGGMEALYGEVLVEAHRRLIGYEQLAAVVSGEDDPKQKLRKVIDLMARTIASPGTPSWAMRVLSREILAPSPTFQVLWDRELVPKRRLFREIIGGILGLPHDHPVVIRCGLTAMAPFLLLFVGDRKMIDVAFPSIRTDIEATIDHLCRFALGGIAAIAETLPLAEAPEGGHGPA